eukprot:TRINITY_DN2651_c0_g1_i2.p2 TRINITY_DN2651_c0_g1~~TRINITY_DN2651_c0_g1_i2.p2  ORF type:complete len:66 (-),score=11.34 TRINITY_DN2651_c0_g1_i2:155-352(-)
MWMVPRTDRYFYDITYAWELLQNNGIMIIDDYLWPDEPIGPKHPKHAIDSFLKCFETEISIIPRS